MLAIVWKRTLNLKNALYIGAFALVISTSVRAQDANDLARQYVNLPAVQQMMTDMFTPEILASQFKAGLPESANVSDEKALRIGKLMAEGLVQIRPKLETMMVEGSARVFSAPELLALIDFYSSEHGAMVMAKMQPFMQTIMVELGPEMQAMQQAILPEIIKIMQEE